MPPRARFPPAIPLSGKYKVRALAFRYSVLASCLDLASQHQLMQARPASKLTGVDGQRRLF